MTFEELIGQSLVFGFPGTRVTDDIIRHFKETHCGGLILYRINFESPDQLRKLITDLENGLERKLLVTVDHEGGRVIMFREGVTIFPSSQAIGKTGNTVFARQQGEQEGRELRRLGIDVNFAPVLDVLTKTYSPNIGIRAYGEEADLVAKMGAARISAMQVEGLSACAKHFPGLGPASLDPHLKLPTIGFTWEEAEKVHLIPFMRAMRTAVHSIMTSHPLYPNLDPTLRTPATFSRAIVGEYLRKRIGYKGVIFTDDLEMGAIQELCPIGEAAVRAMEAGHDVVLSCHDMIAQKKVFATLLDAYKSKRLPIKELEDSYQRVQALRAKRTERFAPLPETPARAQREWDEAQKVVQDICAQAATVVSNGSPLRSGVPTLVIAPRLSAIKDRVMIEKAQEDEAGFVKQALQPLGVTPTVHLVDLDPPAEQIAAAALAASQAAQTILFVFDAHIFESNKKLLEAVQSAAPSLAVILGRDVYDAEFIKAGVLGVTGYGIRICEINAALKKIFTPDPVPAS
jgi:beta-N-acetylhexosaminidase